MSPLSFAMTIPKRGTHCVKGGELLSAGTEYHSILVEEGSGEIQRQDYCDLCWKEVGMAASEQARSSWRSRVPSRKEVLDKTALLDRDARALHILREILDSPTVADLEEAFVLALYLARRRQIALRGQLAMADGGQAQLYEVVATEEMLTVRRVALSQLQIERIQEKLVQRGI
jgi:hypothetical protein